MKIPFSAMLIRWWDGPPVIVLVPSSEPVLIRKDSGHEIPLHTKIPMGAVRGLPLTKERKRFLVKEGLNPELIERGLVFDVSAALAYQFDKERDAAMSVARQCGLTSADLGKIFEAKIKLAAFKPSNREERMAKRGLEFLFTTFPGKRRAKEGGRPSRVTAEERQELRERAVKLEAEGTNRREIVAQFSEIYELRPSYIRRILEDRHKPK